MADRTERQGPPARAAFARFVPLATRWSDNDAYGHLNNVVYYSLFDTAVNAILIEAGLLDPAASPIVGLVVETNCRYFSSLTYPDLAEVGVAVEHLGRTSVRYHLAVFKAGAPLPPPPAASPMSTSIARPVPSVPPGHRELMAHRLTGQPLHVGSRRVTARHCARIAATVSAAATSETRSK